jgi:hypothetical protein
MKSKSHKLLQITTIAIIAFALYTSIISEGFQTIPKSKTVIDLFNSIKLPAWYTAERSKQFETVNKSVNQQDPAVQKIINDTFNSSKAGGDTDDISFDKIMNAELKYESDRKQNSVESKTTDVNFGLYIGIGIVAIFLIAVLIHFLIK